MGRKFSYIDMMRTMPAKAVYNKQVEKHSEMLKPYKHDGYQEMEHFYPDYNWNWDFDFNVSVTIPRSDGDLNGLPPDIPKRENTCEDFDCFWYKDEIIWVCDKNKSVYAKPFDKFADVSVSGPIALVSWSKSKYTIIEATVIGGEYGIHGERGQVQLKFTPDSDTFPCECKTEIIVPNGCGDCACDDVSNVSFDEDQTPDTIVAGGSITVFISGGCPPYTWSVSGSGYGFNDNVTNELTNTLNLVGGVCDTDFDPQCTMTITDACGNSDTLVVIYTGGQWVNIYSCVNGCAGGEDLVDGSYATTGCKWLIVCSSIGSDCPDCTCPEATAAPFGCPGDTIDPSLYCGGGYPCCFRVRYYAWICT